MANIFLYCFFYTQVHRNRMWPNGDMAIIAKATNAAPACSLKTRLLASLARRTYPCLTLPSIAGFL